MCVYVYVHVCVCWLLPPADILDRVSPKLEEWGLLYECVGGGRIQHDSANKKLFVYGYSMVRWLLHRGREGCECHLPSVILKLLHSQWNLSIKDTLNKGHYTNEDTVCSPDHIELCTNLPLN